MMIKWWWPNAGHDRRAATYGATVCAGQEDGERLLRNCKRYDLLNEFYQNRGQWSKVRTSPFFCLAFKQGPGKTDLIGF